MTGIQPFQGQVVRQGAAHDVVSPAYDALTVEQRQQFRRDHPHSYLHVTRSAADEPDAETVDNATLVRRGRAALDEILASDHFQPVDAPIYMVYGLTEGDHQQLGVVCEVASDHFKQVAKPHEATQPARAALLAEHFAVVQAASSPIACAVSDEGELASLLAHVAHAEAILDIDLGDGLRQQLWQVVDQEHHERLDALLGEASLYIIDGHHRAAANQQLLERGTSIPVLATVFPQQSLQLVGFHRLLKTPAGLSNAELLDRVARRFRIERSSTVTEVKPGQLATVIDGEWHVIHLDERPVAGSAQVLLGSLDPVVLEREILQSVVGRYGKLDVTFMPDTEPFEAIVATADRQGRIPIFVPPVAIADMMAVADGGLIMPAKSTYFTPKVRSGLFLRMLTDEFDSI